MCRQFPAPGRRGRRRHESPAAWLALLVIAQAQCWSDVTLLKRERVSGGAQGSAPLPLPCWGRAQLVPCGWQ